MGSRICTRTMEINDLAGVFALGNKIYKPGDQGPFHWNENTIADILCRDMGLSLVAARKKEITGFLIASKNDGAPPVATIFWLAVTEGLKNSGIEEMLLSALGERLMELNIPVMEFTLEENNGEMKKILGEKGFTENKRYLSMQLKLSHYQKKI